MIVAVREAGAENGGLTWLGLDVLGTARESLAPNKVLMHRISSAVS